MWPATRASTTVGLDVGTDAVRAVVLRHSQGQPVLVDAGEAPLDDRSGFGEEHDPTIASAAAAALLERLRVRRGSVAIAIPYGDAILTRMTLGRRRWKALDREVRSSIREARPLRTEDVGVAWDAQPSRVDGSERLSVLAIAARRPAVEDRIAVVAQAGHVPVVVDVDALALANAHALNYPEQSGEPVMLINVSQSRAMVCVLGDDGLAAAFDVEAPATNIMGVAAGIERGLHHHRSGPSAIAGPFGVLLSGEACKAPGLLQRLSQELRARVEFFDPFRHLPGHTTTIERELAGPAFAVAVGLAMRRKGDS
jgi:Tfp pilus assembly PilM family ATPase